MDAVWIVTLESCTVQGQGILVLDLLCFVLYKANHGCHVDEHLWLIVIDENENAHSVLYPFPLYISV